MPRVPHPRREGARLRLHGLRQTMNITPHRSATLSRERGDDDCSRAARHVGHGRGGWSGTARVGRPRPCERVAQFATPHAVKPRRESRARRLLDLYLHQLAAHASVRSRLGTEVQAGARRDRRAHTRIRSSKRTSRTCDALCSRCGSSIRSSSTTTTQSGAPSRTNTGPPFTSSTGGDAFGSISSARASTSDPRRPSNSC